MSSGADFSADTTGPLKPAGGSAETTGGRTDIPEYVGRYRIDELLGQGQFGRVFRRYDPHVDRVAAIKLLHRSSDLAEEIENFREGSILASLNHDGIVHSEAEA